MSRRPDFEQLVGADELAPDEIERLRGVHDLLVAAGPPPELPPALERAPEVDAPVTLLPRRRRAALALLAAALALASFGAGYLVSGRGGGSGFKAERSIPAIAMHGTAAAPGALASIRLGPKDAGGNWPMLFTVQGLKELPPNQYYELYLSRGGKPVATCGTFRVHGGTTTLQLNAPYKLKRFTGWIVTMHGHGVHRERTLLTT